jgi:hypothetical protein
MSRPSRVEYPGAAYPPTCRGNEKKNIAMIGLEEPHPARTLAFDKQKKRAVTGFKHDVEKGVGVEYSTEALQAGTILGNSRFFKKIRELIEKKSSDDMTGSDKL